MKLLKVIDTKTGEELESVKFDGEYNIVYGNKDNSPVKSIKKLSNGRFGLRHWIRNYYYGPIAEQLISKFPEIKHIIPSTILFIEDTEWEPKGAAKNTWVARVKKANSELSNMLGYYYIMEFRKHFIEQMQPEQIIAVVYHELRHIGPDGNLIRHTVEDWDNMIATLGIGWASTQARILNILDEIDDWDYLKPAAKQTNIYDFIKQVK